MNLFRGLFSASLGSLAALGVSAAVTMSGSALAVSAPTMTTNCPAIGILNGNTTGYYCALIGTGVSKTPGNCYLETNCKFLDMFVSLNNCNAQIHTISFIGIDKIYTGSALTWNPPDVESLACGDPKMTEVMIVRNPLYDGVGSTEFSIECKDCDS